MQINYKTIKYSDQDNYTWYNLFKQQKIIIKNLAYSGFYDLLNELNMPNDRVPQIQEISCTLEKKCQWRLLQTDKLITFDFYINLLANKVFPIPFFVGKQKVGFHTNGEIFHELFGHATMLLNSAYATFLERLAKVALRCNKLEQIVIEKIYWFTIEIGLIKEDDQLRTYGSTLLSAPDESIYSIKSHQAMREKFNVIKITQTPLISEIFNKYFYYISDFNELLEINLSHEALDKCISYLK